MKYAQPKNKKIIKTTIKLSAIILISTLTINANAADITPNDIKQLAQNTQADSMHKYSADGKIKYEYQIKTGADGKPELVTKKSYLPAVTDGKIIDKTRSYKLALNAKKFGKYLGKGLGYASFAQMAIDLLGAGVDYVLDPANNTIQKINRQLRCQSGPPINLSANTPDELMDLIFAHPTFKRNHTNPQRDRFSYNPNNRVISYNGYSYGGCQEQKKDVQVMSEEEFAKDVLKAAATQDNDKAKKVVVDYVKQEILDGDHDDTINDIVRDINSDTNTQPAPTDNPTPSKDTDNNPNSNPQTNPNTEPNPKPKDDGGGFELPPFCSWASHVCKFIDWFKEDPNLGEPDKIDIPLEDRNDLAQQDINKQYYNALGQCPAPAVVNTNFGQIKIPYDTLCNFFARHSPILIAIAYLIGGYIVIGRR